MNWLTIPNAFTLFRILLTPFILLELSRGHWLAGGWMLGAAGISDIADGTLARKFNWHSKAGQLLDPIADKLMLGTVYLGLGLGGALPVWLIVLVFTRDLWILAMSAWAFRIGATADLKPSIWGKLSTFCQIMTAVGTIAARAYGEAVFLDAAEFFSWITACFTAFSGAHYTWRGICYLRKH